MHCTSKKVVPSSEKPLSVLEIAPVKRITKFLRRDRPLTVRTADLCMPDLDDKVDLMDLHRYVEA